MAESTAEQRGFVLWAPLLVVVLAVFMFSLEKTMMNAAVEAMQAAWLVIVALILIGLLLTTFLPATKLEDQSMASYAQPAEEA